MPPPLAPHSAAAPPPRPSAPRPSPAPGARTDRVRVRDGSGRTFVARIYGDADSGLVLTPDGQIARSDRPVFTDEPFVPASIEEVRDALLDGPFAGFRPVSTDHYLVLTKGSLAFAEASGRLLESLYRGLRQSLGRLGLAVREAEFPLVAVIYPTEAEFRARKPIDPEVEAYYEVTLNRIYFYEKSERGEGPEIQALRKPQTVAHEGAHQILQNIGVQPRLSPWPAWLVEGLAEFCAPASVGPEGRWVGLNQINPFHMATLRDLDDPMAAQLEARGLIRPRVGRAPGASLAETLASRTSLSPTDYALSWALVHYLFNHRHGEFVRYLRALGKRPPREAPGPQAHLAHFRRAFGRDLGAMDVLVHRHLCGLTGFEPIGYYAVVFEQPVGPNLYRRGTLVSQSPSFIRQWLEAMVAPDGGVPSWEVLPFETRTRAWVAVQEWFATR